MNAAVAAYCEDCEPLTKKATRRWPCRNGAPPQLARSSTSTRREAAFVLPVSEVSAGFFEHGTIDRHTGCSQGRLYRHGTLFGQFCVLCRIARGVVEPGHHRLHVGVRLQIADQRLGLVRKFKRNIGLAGSKNTCSLGTSCTMLSITAAPAGAASAAGADAGAAGAGSGAGVGAGTGSGAGAGAVAAGAAGAGAFIVSGVFLPQ